MKVQVYDNLDQAHPQISFYTKRGKVVLNFARRTLVVSEKVFDKPQKNLFSWREILRKKFK